MSNRRDFLRKSLAGAAVIAMPAVITSKALAANHADHGSASHGTAYKIGVQLWGLRARLLEDPDSILKLVSNLGSEGVEYSGMTSIPAMTYRLAQNKYNLACCGIHYGLTDWIESGAVPKMEYNYILGNPDISCHWLDPHQRGTLENYLSHAKMFNEYARTLKANGFTFYYHNHAFEYTDVFNGKFAMDIMLENTDPALVHMEFHYSGLPESMDIPKYIENLGGRLLKLHLPVLDRDGNVVLTQEIINAARKSGSCKWFIIEQPIPDQPNCESLARSIKILRDMLNS